MIILTGDDCGILKESIVEISGQERKFDTKKLSNNYCNNNIVSSKDYTNISDIDNELIYMNRSRGIIQISFNSPMHHNPESGKIESSHFSFCILRADGSIEQWSGKTPSHFRSDEFTRGSYTCMGIKSNIFNDNNKSTNINTKNTKFLSERPISMHSTQIFPFPIIQNNTLVCCTNFGSVTIFNQNNIGDGFLKRYNLNSSNRNDSKLGLKWNIDSCGLTTATDMEYGGERIALGGRQKISTLIDIETGNMIWKAKNNPPNPQTMLQQPIWPTALRFLYPTSNSLTNTSSNVLAVGTAYRQLQIYDVRVNSVQRRPILCSPEWDSCKKNILNHRVTCLNQINTNEVVVGDSAGYIHVLDLRKIIKEKVGWNMGSNVGKISNFAGSVRQIHKHKTLPIISCISLDRMLRTYDLNKMIQLDCIYLKQQLNCMLVLEDEN